MGRSTLIINVPQLVVMLLMSVLMKKLGKSRVFIIGTGLMSVGFIAFYFCESSLPLLIVCNAVKGCGLGMASGMALGLVAFVTTFHLERDMEELRKEKSFE